MLRLGFWLCVFCVGQVDVAENGQGETCITGTLFHTVRFEASCARVYLLCTAVL